MVVLMVVVVVCVCGGRTMSVARTLQSGMLSGCQDCLDRLVPSHQWYRHRPHPLYTVGIHGIPDTCKKVVYEKVVYEKSGIRTVYVYLEVSIYLPAAQTVLASRTQPAWNALACATGYMARTGLCHSHTGCDTGVCTPHKLWHRPHVVQEASCPARRPPCTDRVGV